MRYRKRDLWLLIGMLESLKDIRVILFLRFIRNIYKLSSRQRRDIRPQDIPEGYRVYFEVLYEDIPLWVVRDELPKYIVTFFKWRLEVGV